MSQQLTILPTLACPASCEYCFGPHAGGPPMGRDTLEAVVRWQKALDDKNPLGITFHGGEPLVPGAPFYRMALPLLREGLAPRPVRFAAQSNLWLLTDELCSLLRAYDVSLGTSLDGPEPINDLQRGRGYFRRTMAGIACARSHGINVGCISTFTPQSAARAAQVFDFFAREGLDFSIHAALPSLDHPGGRWALSPEAHGQLLVEMLERYLARPDRVRISTLDAMCRSVPAGRGGVCTFGDCLGDYVAVDPEGWVYACQRFAGRPEYRLGNVHDCPSREALAATPAWTQFQDRQERIAEACGDCPHLDYCRGGCPYNAVVASGNGHGPALRDPHCPAYRRAFNTIVDRALEDVFSEENLAAVVDKGAAKHGLMHQGPLLTLMRGGPHPVKTARRARELVAAVALAASASPAEALHKLDRAGLVTRPERALGSLAALRQRLDTQSQQGLVNAYIHVTYACNLTCNHCYAKAGPAESPAMEVNNVVRLVRETAQAGFRKAVITGGEPLVHPQRVALLDALAVLRAQVKPLQTVIRTNLAYPLTPKLVERLAHSSDQIVVSVDGDETSHDARRGANTYALTVANLQVLLAANPTTEVCITAVLTAGQTAGPQGDAVRALGEELGVRARFKSVLPLGRGADLGLTPAFYSSLEDGVEAVAYDVGPAATCGLGMNLYVDPEGECYPCYALVSGRHALGNALNDGMPAVLGHDDTYRKVTVDSNQQCSACALRYLCGGFCRAWSVDEDPNSPWLDCSGLYAQALERLCSALEVLQIPPDKWASAGLEPNDPPSLGSYRPGFRLLWRPESP